MINEDLELIRLDIDAINEKIIFLNEHLLNDKESQELETILTKVSEKIIEYLEKEEYYE